MIKPDGVRNRLVGRILARFEEAGLTILDLRLVYASREMIEAHYPSDESWLTEVGRKTLETYEKYGMRAEREIGTADPVEIGRRVKSWLASYLTSGPIVAMVLEGNHAIDIVRKLVGSTIPLFAAPGTIRGDFSVDSPAIANAEKRAVWNLIHASGSREEAGREIQLWFGRKDEMEVKDLNEAFLKALAVNKREAAEIAYVCAVTELRKGNREKARDYALQSIALFRDVGVNSYEDAAARYVTINEVALPSYIHEDVVIDRMRRMGLDLEGALQKEQVSR
jgi:nucleoside-diphosphate kinase